MEVAGRSDSHPIRRGEALFVSDADGPIQLGGDGTVAVASVPLD